MTVQRYKKFIVKPNIFRIIFELFLAHFEGRNAQQSNAQLFEITKVACCNGARCGFSFQFSVFYLGGTDGRWQFSHEY